MNQPPVRVTTRPVRQTSRLRPLLLVSALTLALVSVGAGAFSLALFTSTTDVTSNTFTTGTIVIGASPASALITYANMLPGDSVTGALTVSNTGTGALRYVMTSSSTNADVPTPKGLRDQMTLVVKTKDSNTAACGNFNGTQLYSGILSGAAFGALGAGSLTARTLAGSDPGPAASEVLCFRAALPIGTGNAFQNATTTTTFTFNAEQTANN